MAYTDADLQVDLAILKNNPQTGLVVRQAIADIAEKLVDVYLTNTEQFSDMKGAVNAILDETFDSASLETMIAEKLAAKEMEYAPKLTEVTTQLARTNNINQNRIIKRTGTTLVAHRGFSSFAPENSIPAFDLAGSLGFEFIEADVRATSDGVLVVIHDETVDRTTNGTGRVSDLTFDQIKQFKIDTGKGLDIYNNCQIPSLEEFLIVCEKWGSRPFLDIKEEAITLSVANLLKKYNLSDKTVIGSTTYRLEQLRSNGFTTPFVVGNANYDNLEYFANISNVIIGTINANKELIEKIHNFKLPISEYNSDNLRNWNKAKSWGIDYYLVDAVIPNEFGGR